MYSTGVDVHLIKSDLHKVDVESNIFTFEFENLVVN